MNIRRGDIFWVDLAKIRPGVHTQKGIRPCVVVSNNKNNLYCSTVQVMPLSTVYDGLPQHTYVYVEGRISYCLPEQITTVEKTLLGYKSSYIAPKDMWVVEKAIQIQFGMWRATNERFKINNM